MSFMRPCLILAAVVLAGCPAEPSKYVEPPDPLVDFSLFPSVLAETRLFADVGGARLEFDPTTKDAIGALGSCLDAVSYCYTPGSKELSWCLQNTRTCATDKPWEEKSCCPQACKDDFEKTVKKGAAPPDALEQVFFEEKDCFPGVRAALEVTP